MAIELQKLPPLAVLDIGTTKKIASPIQGAMQDGEQTISTIKTETLSRKKTFTKQIPTPILEAIG